ncbi:uncharacterized protein FIBRA_00542 [Fibroporia radiculosa]|uniref:Terpene synthase n=1 Tax=Fibroporia radiculosa TaxID=599839 RepID=J4HRS3_9APHY|nr:uncharacterized protein FIBRA_00542 [Fibroporia radiculosa]CCL98542.1 predicted protein [Fibroporia radiculosa]
MTSIVNYSTAGDPNTEPSHPISAEPQREATVVARKSVTYFLREVHYSFSPFQRDPELEARVKDITRTWTYEEQIRPQIITGLAITEAAYPHLTMKTKVGVALFTASTTAMDGPETPNKVASSGFHRKLCDGAIYDEGNIFADFVTILSGTWQCYPPFGSNMIMVSALQFMNASILEGLGNGAAITSRSFVEYRRFIGGMPEAYAYFIWEKARFPDERVYLKVLPDAVSYINFTNDIMSFYKEVLEGDTTNYISDRARVTSKSILETLQDTVDETVAAHHRIRSILGEGAARDAWDSFANGYISFHLGDPRYRLRDLLDCEYLFNHAEY